MQGTSVTILSSILPARAKCASLRLNNVQEVMLPLQSDRYEGMAHLLTNILPAVRTLLGVLDDWVFGDKTPHAGEKIQDSTKGDKVDKAVDEGATDEKM